MSEQFLSVITGSLAGTTVSVKRECTIGRHHDNDLVLDDSSVSRHHAVVRCDGHKSIVLDLGGTNGVVINGRRVYEFELYDGDILHLGSVSIKFSDSAIKHKDKERTRTGVLFDSSDSQSVISSSSVESLSQSFFVNELDNQQAPLKRGAKNTSERLKALYKANQEISLEQDLSTLLSKILKQIFDLTSAENGVVMLVNEKSKQLTIECKSSRDGDDDELVSVSMTIVNRAVDTREAIMCTDTATDIRFAESNSIIASNISSAMCVPLIHGDTVLGVIYLDSRSIYDAFDESDLQYIAAFAGPAAVAIKNARYVSMLEKSYHETLVVLANAIELRDHYTAGHIWRVTNFAIAIAEELGLSKKKIKEVEMGGVVHDMGKISVDNAILSKPSRLTDEEYDKMKVHPERGAWMLKGASFLEPLIPYCLYHHERWDGTGYPYGLAKGKIPLEGRIVAVADAFDAMTSHRPYSRGVSVEVAIERVRDASGSHFDPDCADALIRAYEKKRIDHIFQDYLKYEKSFVCPFCSTSIQIPENWQDIEVFECDVCHRHIELNCENGAFLGKLVH